MRIQNFKGNIKTRRYSKKRTKVKTSSLQDKIMRLEKVKYYILLVSSSQLIAQHNISNMIEQFCHLKYLCLELCVNVRAK